MGFRTLLNPVATHFYTVSAGIKNKGYCSSELVEMTDTNFSLRNDALNLSVHRPRCSPPNVVSITGPKALGILLVEPVLFP